MLQKRQGDSNVSWWAKREGSNGALSKVVNPLVGFDGGTCWLTGVLAMFRRQRGVPCFSLDAYEEVASAWNTGELRLANAQQDDKRDSVPINWNRLQLIGPITN